MADEQTQEDSGKKLKEPLLEDKSQPPASDKKEPVSLVSVGQLFRYSDNIDRILIFLGVIGSIVVGVITPAQFILFGSVTDDFVAFTICKTSVNCTTIPDLEGATATIAYWYIVFGVANFVFAWMGMGLFGLSAERQVHKMRMAMLENVIYQEIGWFDEHSSGELNTRLTEDINKIADGIGSKYGRMLSCIFTFIAGYVIGFIYNWKMTLVLLGSFPVGVFVGGAMAKVTGNFSAKELEAYSKAGHVAEQSISSIRTVEAFGAEEKQAELYDKHLEQACAFGVRKGLAVGVGMGAFQCWAFLNMALSFWYIIKLIRDGDTTGGDGLTVFFAVTLASFNLGQAAPSGEALATARGAAFTVFSIIDRKSNIDASSDSGQKLEQVNGDVEFSHIDFVYPTRQSVQVLKDFSLKIPKGKRVALVGESGSGKSTVVKLLQRFYDPTKGTVTIDGRNIKSLNVRHLRSLIGVVNQEPVLFATTIAENIAFGRDGVTQPEIEEAAKIANAHEFITHFPQGYNTLCGERGAQMSGGQKQRISIARALVRNPKILLLDEATSALDTESEVIVQEALERAEEGRTSVIIAHRLSTIRNADVIVAVNEGQVAEMGTHDELIALDGLYSSLVKLQEGEGDEDDDNDHDNDQNDVSENDANRIIGKGKKLDAAIKLGSVATLISEYRPLTEKSFGEDKVRPVSFGSILKLNAPEWHYLLFGCIGAGLFGTYPWFYGYSFGFIFEIFANNPSIPDEDKNMKNASAKWALLYVLAGVICGFGVFLQNWGFSKAGEALTKELRKRVFLAFLRKDIGYYDQPNHGTGAICTRLSEEVSTIQGATGGRLGLLAATFVTIVGGLAIGFSASWKLSLVMVAFTPFCFLSGLTLNRILGGGDKGASDSGAGQAADEPLSNIQTVVSLGREKVFLERYHQALVEPYRKAKRSSHFAGLTFGSTMGFLNFAYAAGFRYSGYLLVNDELTIKDMMISIMSILTSVIIIGQVASMTPDYTRAKQAANRVFHLLKQVPHIDSFSKEGKKPEACKGEVELCNVLFRYPTRRNFKVLRNLSFTAKPGQTVALVGTSGCGKSTSVALVERFYDVNNGSVMIDGNNVQELNLKWLRRQIGIVSQEPVLFDVSIRENIAYGDTTRVISDNEIKEAAKAANIHDFISKLPEGYDTMVGDKGTLISGGQKQRIAIARAMIRDPKILLLDEATSALDTESEKVVQQALDKARVGRTTVIIAHRLSTIQNADVIVVIKNGRVVEQGTHQQLLALKGIYSALYKAQSLSGADS